jgi:hypothetical protein
MRAFFSIFIGGCCGFGISRAAFAGQYTVCILAVAVFALYLRTVLRHEIER